jgi:hypothetical protein
MEKTLDSGFPPERKILVSMNCPPKTDLRVMIGFRKNGSRKWQNKEGIHQNKSY